MNKDKQNKECEGNCLNVCKSHNGEFDFCNNIGCKCHTQAPHPLTQLLNNKEKMLEIGRKATEDQKEIFSTKDNNFISQPNKCKNCSNLHNGSIIKVESNGNCAYCGRTISYTPKLLAQKKCNHQTCKEEGEYCLWERMKVDQKKECCENYPICECHTQAPQEDKECKHKFIDADKCKGCNEVFEDIWKAPQEENKYCCSFGNYPSVVHTMDCPNFVPQKKDTSEPEDIWFKKEEDIWFEKEMEKVRQQTISSVIEEIEGIKRPFKVSENMELREAYNQALEDLKTLLKQKIN